MSDATIDELSDAFEANHAISAQLLQFINSAAFHLSKKISSIKHILTLVGRIPLTEWLMLMIYAKSVTSEDSQSPLILMVTSSSSCCRFMIRPTRTADSVTDW